MRKTPSVTITLPAAAVETVDARAARNNNTRSGQIATDLADYYAILDRTGRDAEGLIDTSLRYDWLLAGARRTLDLTDAETGLISGAFVSTRFSKPWTIGAMQSGIADAIDLEGLDEQFGVDRNALLAKVEGYSDLQKAVIVDALESWRRRALEDGGGDPGPLSIEG